MFAWTPHSQSASVSSTTLSLYSICRKCFVESADLGPLRRTSSFAKLSKRVRSLRASSWPTTLTMNTEDPDNSNPSKWHAIAKHVPNRTNKDCRKRWFAKMASDVVKGGWAPDEDEKLVKGIERYGTRYGYSFNKNPLVDLVCYLDGHWLHLLCKHEIAIVCGCSIRFLSS